MQKVAVCVRRVIETRQLELFFANDCGMGYWWIEGFNPRNGHFEASRDYLRRKTEPLDYSDPYIATVALNLAQQWAAIGEPIGEPLDVRLASSVRGPRGMHYGGD